MAASHPADALPEAPPEIVLQEARAAAAANDEEEEGSRHRGSDHKPAHHHRDYGHEAFPNVEDVPPPLYNGANYGQLDIDQNGMQTGAQVAADGRINIKINQRSRKLTNLLGPVLRSQLDSHPQEEQEPYIPFGLGGAGELPPPPMNIVIQIVGSRGDVQPFIALGQVLKNNYKHRVRVATHPNFRDFVTDNGLEFFSIGGDPAELMAFMVKNPGLMPGFDSLKSGDVGKRRKGIYEMIQGCWRSCIEAGDGTGVPASDDMLGTSSGIDAQGGDATQRPFVADAIIANPPSFAHMHLAEKLGIPLHLMFTMPWSPTQAFPHPLANIQSSNTDNNMTNFITYALVDMLTWQGLGDMINKFREQTLHLEPVSIMWAPGMASRLRIPWTYCWSPALIPKPRDWGNYIDISGFYFLNLATSYTPAPDLAEFLAAGPPPVYIGFGSIVVDDPNAMTKMIFDAVKKTGQRALVSKGWGGLGADELGIPEGVFMLGNVPHDWLFKHVSCVVHHGGAGTTAAGISAGRPTVVVPFFGDQPFWGAMTARAGAGPMPMPYKTLTADKLANAIMEALKPESLERAAELSAKIRKEDGCQSGADSFHKHLHLSELRCSLYPRNTAVWRVKRTDIRLSALAATVLGNEGLLDFSDLKLYRPREYETEDGPWEPISGGAAALIGTFGNLTMGIADFPVEILKSLRTASMDVREKHKEQKASVNGSETPLSASRHDSSTDLSPLQLPIGPLTADPLATTAPDGTANDDSSTSTDAESIISRGTTTPTGNVQRKPSALSTVLSAEGESRHRSRWSRRGSQTGSPSGEKRAHSPFMSPEDIRDDARHITVESAVGGVKAVSKIVEAGLKSPMDFTMSLAKGFHNAPKLYGDDTVRAGEKITGLQSGIKAAGLEFGFGFFDGITGLVTQPLAGAKKEGAAGFVKGAAKGIGGLILKPAAGIWGIPGYTFKGIYTELQRHFGSSVHNYIIAARTAQGYEEWKASSAQQRAEIVAAWKSTELQMRRKGKKYGKEREEEIQSHILTHTRSNSVELMSGFKNTRHLSWDERKVLAMEKDKVRKEKKERERAEAAVRKNSKVGGAKRCKYCPFDHESSYHLRPSQSVPSRLHPHHNGRSDSQTSDQLHDEFEEAIQRSVTATSTGDPRQDALIERALRASVRELQSMQGAGKHADDATYERAVAASVNEIKLARAERTSDAANHPPGTLSSGPTPPPHDDTPPSYEEHLDDLALTKALTQSLEDYKLSRAHDSHRSFGDETVSPDVDDSDSGMGTEDDEAYKATLEESRRVHTENEEKRQANVTAASEAQVEKDDNDEHKEDMKKAMDESNKHAADLARQQREEEIVLEYVKKQSLLEEEHRRKLAEVRGSTGPA